VLPKLERGGEGGRGKGGRGERSLAKVSGGEKRELLEHYWSLLERLHRSPTLTSSMTPSTLAPL